MTYIETIKNLNTNNQTPQELLNDWLDFYDEIKDGYNWIHPELNNDFDTNRLPIQELIENENLLVYKEHQEFIQKVNEIDNLILNYCCVVEEWKIKTKYWWHSVILKEAGPVYADWAKSNFQHLNLKTNKA